MQINLFEPEKPKSNIEVNFYLKHHGYLAGVGVPGIINDCTSLNYYTGESEYTQMMKIEVLHVQNRKAYCRCTKEWAHITGNSRENIYEVDIRNIGPDFHEKQPYRIQKKLAKMFLKDVFKDL